MSTPKAKTTFIFALLATALFATAQAAELRRIPLTLNLDGFESHAELTLPADGDGPFPAVLLIHGASPEDMNAEVRGLNQQPVSHIFKTISDTLSARGFAVLRYNKRCVRQAYNVDFACYRALTQRDLLADAQTALDALAARSEVDRQHLFVYGWSEGTLVAGALAAKAKLAGVILQGPVYEPIAKTIGYQINEVLLPYLKQYAHDGTLGAKQVQATMAGPAGLWMRMLYLRALSSRADPAHVNPYLDANQDGKLSLEQEIRPGLIRFTIASFGSADTRLPVLSKDIATLAGQPVLILQGESDGAVAPRNARELATALNARHADVTLKIYPGLGHTLGQSEAPIDEGFRPIAAQPLEDVVAWLEAASR
ncbi:MAG TPA: alpha/beta fold hydrolase [Gammaproteobacteria bacterium]|nr:alpha/beta fold hydrolase [Gammaproteobacteria bacterium]